MGGVVERTAKHYMAYALEALDYPVPAIFTLTTGRSGTQWLAKVLNHVECFRVFHEPAPSLTPFGARELDGYVTPWEAIRVARSTLIRHAHCRQQVYVELSPFLSPVADQIVRSFKDARFIHLWRHPREYVVSALNQGWYQADTTKSHWWPASYHNERWKRAIEHWGKTHRAALEAERNYDTFRISSSELWSNPDAVLDLLDWVGVNPLVNAQVCQVIADLDPVGQGRKEITWDHEWDAFLEEEAGDVWASLETGVVIL